ncbi:MAG: hypothetical protein Q7K55_04240 [Candidatus Levybacteria bacterium]|nr:hypothetical protein [Candidatus Levybacteria bacterium]
MENQNQPQPSTDQQTQQPTVSPQNPPKSKLFLILIISLFIVLIPGGAYILGSKNIINQPKQTVIVPTITSHTPTLSIPVKKEANKKSQFFISFPDSRGWIIKDNLGRRLGIDLSEIPNAYKLSPPPGGGSEQEPRFDQSYYLPEDDYTIENDKFLKEDSNFTVYANGRYLDIKITVKNLNSPFKIQINRALSEVIIIDTSNIKSINIELDKELPESSHVASIYLNNILSNNKISILFDGNKLSIPDLLGSFNTNIEFKTTKENNIFKSENLLFEQGFSYVVEPLNWEKLSIGKIILTKTGKDNNIKKDELN